MHRLVVEGLFDADAMSMLLDPKALCTSRGSGSVHKSGAAVSGGRSVTLEAASRP